MPLTRCPRCAHRQLIAIDIVDELVGCNRCDRVFKAAILTGTGRLRDLVMVAAALAVGAVVAWMLVRGGT